MTTAEIKFWESLLRTESGCWEWTRGRYRKGYGQVRHAGRPRRAHRVAWEMARGDIPEGLMVLHSCDNPPCCNPDHLFLGTAADNSFDMRQKGRAKGGGPSGERHWAAKLSMTQVADIRRRRMAGEKNIALAREFGISASSCSAICLGQTWTERS